jgi:hypothetical protein
MDLRTEAQHSGSDEGREKISILQAALQPEGLSFIVMKNIYNRQITPSK